MHRSNNNTSSETVKACFEHPPNLRIINWDQ